MDAKVAMVALYLRGLRAKHEDEAGVVRGRGGSGSVSGSGARVGDRHRWPFVLRALQAQPGEGKQAAIGVLREEGLGAEADRLGADGLWEAAAELVRLGQVRTAADVWDCGGVPERWIQVMGSSAPPAMWASGGPYSIAGEVVEDHREVLRATSTDSEGGDASRGKPRRRAIGGGSSRPEISDGLGRRGMQVGLVGTREPTPRQAIEVRRVARQIIEAGGHLVSGGAKGVDTLARSAAVAAGVEWTEIAPAGPDALPRGGCSLSVNAPGSSFGVASAMERNALIYAACDFVVAVGPRFRAGGTWHGAVNAMRRRLSTVVVLAEEEITGSENIALRALQALGAGVLRPGECPFEVFDSMQEERWGGICEMRLPLAEPW